MKQLEEPLLQHVRWQQVVASQNVGKAAAILQAQAKGKAGSRSNIARISWSIN
jgi:hypothetical protein